MIASLKSLLEGIVDYAGLFPPAQLTMAAAVTEYDKYLSDPNRFMLARFVVPAAKLDSFVAEAESKFTKNSSTEPWRLSALIGADTKTDIAAINDFNRKYSEKGATIDVVELKANTEAEIDALLNEVPVSLQRFVEVPVVDVDPAPLIRTIAAHSNAFGKIRTGGITQAAFPSPKDIAKFIRSCNEANLAFKATAGLHHPIRNEYRLTYEESPPVGTMYGYLNIFVAALFTWLKAPESLILDILQDKNSANFEFSKDGIKYLDHTATIEQIREVRSNFATSFGSCSFREPVDDLKPLGLLA